MSPIPPYDPTATGGGGGGGVADGVGYILHSALRSNGQESPFATVGAIPDPDYGDAVLVMGAAPLTADVTNDGDTILDVLIMTFVQTVLFNPPATGTIGARRVTTLGATSDIGQARQHHAYVEEADYDAGVTLVLAGGAIIENYEVAVGDGRSFTLSDGVELKSAANTDPIIGSPVAHWNTMTVLTRQREA